MDGHTVILHCGRRGLVALRVSDSRFRGNDGGKGFGGVCW